MKRYAFEKLKIWKESKNRKPLVIRGARQVGKTWLMKAFAKEFYKNLANSRFCQFIKIYTGEDNLKSYYKYFKYK